jgi:hypothetical protein
MTYNIINLIPAMGLGYVIGIFFIFLIEIFQQNRETFTRFKNK